MIQSGLVRYHPALGPLLVPIDDVHPAPYNYNNADIDEIVASIEQVGMYGPVIAQVSTGDIVVHNHVWMACYQMQAKVIPVVWLDITDVVARQMMVADNEIARRAMPDSGLLTPILADIKEEIGHLMGTGVTEDELATMEHLARIPLHNDERVAWVPLSVDLPPHLHRAYLWMTKGAETDRERVELLLRKAGWDG